MQPNRYFEVIRDHDGGTSWILHALEEHEDNNADTTTHTPSAPSRDTVPPALRTDNGAKNQE